MRDKVARRTSRTITNGCKGRASKHDVDGQAFKDYAKTVVFATWTCKKKKTMLLLTKHKKKKNSFSTCIPLLPWNNV